MVHNYVRYVEMLQHKLNVVALNVFTYLGSAYIRGDKKERLAESRISLNVVSSGEK